jgi:penicillin-binding protein 1A
MLAAPVWGQYIVSVSRRQQPRDFSVPETGLVRQTICLDSGLVPHDDGKCTRVAKDELFLSGTEPGDYCPLHPAVSAAVPGEQKKNE